jgi:hypothetical protein
MRWCNLTSSTENSLRRYITAASINAVWHRTRCKGGAHMPWLTGAGNLRASAPAASADVLQFTKV